MTGPTRDLTTGRRGGHRQRIATLLRTEAQLLWRCNVIAAAAVATGIWVVVLRAVPADVRSVLAPIVLLTDVAALGFLFVPALLVVERVEGVDMALRMTPVRPAERVGARVAPITLLAVASGAIVCVAAGLPDPTIRLLGVALLSVLFGLIAFAVTGGAATLTTFVTRAPFVAAPLIAPALVHLVGLTASPALYISPVSSAVDLLRGDLRWSGLAWQVICILVVAMTVGRIERRPRPGVDGAAVRTAPQQVLSGVWRERRWPAHDGRYSVALAVRSFVRADGRALVGDGLLLMLLLSVPLVTLVMRVFASVGVGWVSERHGLALMAHLPLIEALLLVIHTPVVFGSLAGLLLLEDRDAGLFGPLTATRAGLHTLLVYRLGAAVMCTTAALALCLPLDGVTRPAGVAGTLATAVAAGATSVIPALAMAAVATNRVQGVAVMKMLGLPLYLPLAAWVVAAPARWAFAPLPTAWSTWASWASTPAEALTAAAGGMIVSVAVGVPLARRALRRAGTG